MRTNMNERQMRGRSFGQNPPNFGSARSDYGDLAYSGRLNKQGTNRGWWDKTSDEISSWLGDQEAERRRRLDERRNRLQNRNYERRNYRGRPLGMDPIESAYYPENVYVQDWHDIRARHVMTRDVATVHPRDSVQYAARLMGECDCGALPVVDWQGRMVGMITDRDITVRLVANGLNPIYAEVGDCMTDKAFACHVNDSLENCMRVMSHHQIRRMPIVDDHNRVVGIVSQSDLAQHAGENRGLGERRAVSNVVRAISEPTEASYS